MLTVGNLRGREHALEKRLATATDSGFNAMHFGDVQTQSDDHESLGRSNGARVNASWLAPAPRASRSRGPAHSFAACQAAYSAREAEIAAPQLDYTCKIIEDAWGRPVGTQNRNVYEGTMALVRKNDAPSREERCGVWVARRTRLCVTLMLVVGAAALILGCEGARKQASSVAEAPPDGATQQATLKAPPIPEAGPLARPKSLRQVGVPPGATRAAIPPDNPQTPEKIALGQRLFFDGRLSADGTVACSTCHDTARAFTDGRPASIGIKGRVGQRNAPTILNALYNKTQFWDGRVKTLEEQAALPIVNLVEMGQPSLDAAVARIAAIDEYQLAFRRVFGRPPTGPDLVRAIASYERTQLSFDSPFDHFIAGDRSAIDDAAKRGWEIFNTRGRCNKCHALTEDKRDVTNFTDNDFHNIGIIRHNVVALA